MQEDNFMSASALTSDGKDIYPTSRYELTKNQSWELGYGLTKDGDSTAGTNNSQKQSVHLTYNYRF